MPDASRPSAGVDRLCGDTVVQNTVTTYGSRWLSSQFPGQQMPSVGCADFASRSESIPGMVRRPPTWGDRDIARLPPVCAVPTRRRSRVREGLARGRPKIYWVEVRKYKPHAYRFIISDQDLNFRSRPEKAAGGFNPGKSPLCAFEPSAAEHGRDVARRPYRRHDAMFSHHWIERNRRSNDLDIGFGR
jgi:hypothetical protein